MKSNNVECHRVIQQIHLDDLQPGHSPRARIDSGHVRQLVAVLDDCPPIVVTDTMFIVDGHHRAAAARVAGRTSISAAVVVLDDKAAFIEAVAFNARHGLPLTRSERAAAVTEVIGVRPEWSDRRIAEVCGVSPSTVGSRRRQMARSGDQAAHLNTREGADGRRYPPSQNREERLEHAIAVLAETPDITTRCMADALGVSIGAAHNLRGEAKQALTVVEEPLRTGLLRRWWRAIRKVARRLRWPSVPPR